MAVANEEFKAQFKEDLEAKFSEMKFVSTPEEEGQFFIELLKLAAACFLFLNKDSFSPEQRNQTEREIFMVFKDLTTAIAEMDPERYEQF